MTEAGEIDKKIEELETAMQDPLFWQDKVKAQELVEEYNALKAKRAGLDVYEKGNAVISILAGAGGADAEDFASMLFRMYQKFAEKMGYEILIVHKNENDHGGLRNITFDILGKGAYGKLKNESGVHRLVRISPFNAKSLRHTSFALVEVIPQIKKAKLDIPESDLRVEFSRSSGPGGQNVNKRETAVRIVHIPTNISVHADGERSQAQNKEKAIEILSGKLFKLQEENRKKKIEGFSVGRQTEIEWGNQIRSYVLHPYQMVKDHRTDHEERDVEKVLEDGEIEGFLKAEASL